MLCALLAILIVTEASASRWIVWVEDGKTGKVEMDYVPTTELLGSYFETLKKITYWNVVKKEDSPGTQEERAPYSGPNVTITDIGAWAVYEVFDVTNRQIKHKSTVLRDKTGRYWILYAQFESSTAEVDDLPAISEAGGQSVLSYRTRVPGTGNFFIEHYFVYDSHAGTPVAIDTSPIDKAVKDALPKGYSVRKGGELDLKAMKYTGVVWKPDDANCRPTGGTIDLVLSLDKGTLRVTGARYTAQNVAP